MEIDFWINSIHKFSKKIHFFIQIVDVIYVVYVIYVVNIYECQNNKERSKILLTFNRFNVFSLHNFGSRLFFTNLRI
jgi:hypothetical protein